MPFVSIYSKMDWDSLFFDLINGSLYTLQSITLLELNWYMKIIWLDDRILITDLQRSFGIKIYFFFFYRQTKEFEELKIYVFLFCLCNWKIISKVGLSSIKKKCIKLQKFLAVLGVRHSYTKEWCYQRNKIKMLPKVFYRGWTGQIKWHSSRYLFSCLVFLSTGFN